MRFMIVRLLGSLLSILSLVAAETGHAGWLRYAPLPAPVASQYSAPSNIIALNITENGPVYTAGLELQKGIQGILGSKVNVANTNISLSSSSPAIIVSTLSQYIKVYGNATTGQIPELLADGFWLDTTGDTVHILGQNGRAALYGAFEYLSLLAQGNFSKVAYATSPDAPIRWVNQWDNMDGHIERGYGGDSIVFANGTIKNDLQHVTDYARLLSSIRINGIIINNVNANATLLNPQGISGIGRVADAFRPYGIQVGISLNFASPTANLVYGNLSTFDPLNQTVINWWTNVTDTIYRRVPDFAGYLVKANSEGQPGPLTYNRTLAEGANMFATALKPHGGILMFRAFVYDNHINETNWKADRANAAVDFFRDLDGVFDDNVVVQVKYGPIDFQVREPPSPLFAHLRQTGAAIELQITQEYLGQQCHLNYLPPLWKEILDFDLRSDNKSSLVSDIVSGRRFNRTLGGYAGVVNVGVNDTWLGSHLSMSNLYAFGRLAWDPQGDSESILQDWTRLTFSSDPLVIDTITDISLESWPTYENYTGNLGIQTLTDILYTHFGPNPASQDNNGWGQWTRADADSIGMDRTVSNGTGFSGQYPPEVAQVFEDISTTPDNLLLWFHHVNYTTRLKSSDKTVIQHFYDAHYAGAENAQTFATRWERLKGKIDDQRYNETLFRLKYQAGHSIVWRDAINEFYHRLSGIADEAKRVGNHPWRIEAESFDDLEGYEVYKVNPFHTASNFTGIVTSSNTTAGTATTKVQFDSGTYNIAVGYWDLFNGTSKWVLSLNNRTIGTWLGDNEKYLGHEPSRYLDGHSATRVTFPNVTVEKGDVLKIVGTPGGIEPAPLDYVAFLPEGVID